MYLLINAWYVFLENIEYYSIFILLFLGIFSLIFGLFSFFANRSQESDKRLSRMLGRQGKKGQAGETSKEQFIPPEKATFASQISRPLQKFSSLEERTKRNKLRLKLIRAGYRSEYAVYNFLAAKIIIVVLFVVGYLFSRLFYSLSADMVLRILLLAVLGYFIPNMWVWLMTKARQERIVKGLPDALDLMVVCVEAGLGLDMTFKRVGDEIAKISKDLSDEFKLTILEIRAGSSREIAFKNMYTRTGVSEINSLVTVLTQTSRFGTSIAKALRVHADAMRVRRRQLAEEVAAKSTVKLVFPLVLFIFPAIFIVLIGAGAIKIIRYLLPALGGG